MNVPKPNTPHHLDLYRLAVQHPLAEVAFIDHCWALTHDDGSEPMLLREDFAGTCAVAAAWCASDPDRQAMAVELDEPTAVWAADRFDDPDLHIVVDDVMAVDEPAVDVTLALNFSVLIYHDCASLQAYLAHALAGLNPGGVLIMDVFGGSGVDEPSVQSRRVEPDEGDFDPYVYEWAQGAVDEQSERIDCRIHFELTGGQRLQDAFIYDWRLWSAQALIDAAKAVGFAHAGLWWSAPGSSGRFVSIAGEPNEADWVAYVVCQAGQ